MESACQSELVGQLRGTRRWAHARVRLPPFARPGVAICPLTITASLPPKRTLLPLQPRLHQWRGRATTVGSLLWATTEASRPLYSFWRCFPGSTSSPLPLPRARAPTTPAGTTPLASATRRPPSSSSSSAPSSSSPSSPVTSANALASPPPMTQGAISQGPSAGAAVTVALGQVFSAFNCFSK